MGRADPHNLTALPIMNDQPVQRDLNVYTQTESPDEERLLTLFRRCTLEQRSEILCRLTRLQFAPFFTCTKVGLGDPEEHLYEELEQSLRDLYPKAVLEKLRTSIQEPQLSGVWIDAWGRIAPVLFGITDRDGRHADALYLALREYCESQGRGRLENFMRRDALELIEVWRETALQALFKHPSASMTPTLESEIAIDSQAYLERRRLVHDHLDGSKQIAMWARINDESVLTGSAAERLFPVLIKLMSAAFRSGFTSFKDASKFILDELSRIIGPSFSDALCLSQLQGAYIALSEYQSNADSVEVVTSVTRRSELDNHVAQTDIQRHQ